MNKYNPTIHDVVFIRKEDMNDNLRELELEVNEEYLVTYVFADGGCVLYKEEAHLSGYLEIYEYVLEEEDVSRLSFVYNHMDEIEKKYDKIDKNKDNFEMWLDHDFKVGDLVYFDDVEVVNFYYESELKNGQPYEIIEFNDYDNSVVISSPIGRLELTLLESMYLKSYDDSINDFLDSQKKEIQRKLDYFDKRGNGGVNMVNKKEQIADTLTGLEIKEISDMLDNLAIDNGIDRALNNENADTEK